MDIFKLDFKIIYARFLMTGSGTLGLLDAAADTLAGRIEIISLPTACWGEDEGQPAHSLLEERIVPPNIKEANRLLPAALTYGQYPEVLVQESEEKKRQVLRNCRNTYFTRDLMQLSNAVWLSIRTRQATHQGRQNLFC